MAISTLGAKEPGSVVKIKENDVAQDFYVAHHNYAPGRTLLVRRYVRSTNAWRQSGGSVYAGSTVDTALNNSYFNVIDEVIRDQIAEVPIVYTVGGGDMTKTSMPRKVFLLSLAEFGVTGRVNVNDEGSPLAVGGMLREPYTNSGNKSTQWTRSPVYRTASGAVQNAVIYWYWNGSYLYHGEGECTSGYGIRPAFTLPASLFVDDDANVFVNNVPVINYSGGTALGNRTEGFTVPYSVSDADSDSVTVTEKLDGVVTRSYTADLEQSQSFQAVLPSDFQTVLNGSHTLNIAASDGKEASAVNITFTKTVYSCSITLSSPLAADDMPTAMRLQITGSIPSDAVWTVEACNNGNDAEPTWENIKTYVQSGYNYVFSNVSKTADDWGVNFRISVQRGPSDTGGYIYAVEGGFQ